MNDDSAENQPRSPSKYPAEALAHFARGNELRVAKRFDEALAEFESAVAADPGFAEAFVNLGHLFERAERTADAIAAYRRAVALNPGLFEAQLNLGNACFRAADFASARAALERAVALQRDSAEAHLNLGVVLRQNNQIDLAIEAFQRALRIRPDYAEGWTNLANACRAQNRIADAVTASRRALALAPESAAAHINYAMCELVAGNLRKGWPHAEFRHALKLGGAGREFSQPAWSGRESLQSQTILLHAEQGIGDTLLFVRYVRMVAARAARVYLEVQPPLRKLLDASMGDVATVIATGDPLPRFDLHCALPSLPMAFDTELATIPADVPYVCPPSERLERWRQILSPTAVKRIGLAWAGNPTHPNDANRSIPLSMLTPLWSRDARPQFLSLKKEMCAADAAILQASPMVDLSDELADFADTAAAIAQLDLVIAVDTSVAHLAAALGRPVWILLPFSPDWRWLLGREDSPWYPTARLFRQPRTGDWESVIRRVADERAGGL